MHFFVRSAKRNVDLKKFHENPRIKEYLETEF